MKTKSVINALDKILNGERRDLTRITYTVGKRQVEVIDQDGNAVCLPIIDGTVVYNGNNTIKNIVSFLTGYLTPAQLDYLKTVKQMYSTTPNEKRIELAKNYESMGGIR